MTNKEITEKLLGLELADDYANEIIEALAGYEYEGEEEIIIAKDMESDCIYTACIDHKDSPIIEMKTTHNVILIVNII